MSSLRDVAEKCSTCNKNFLRFSILLIPIGECVNPVVLSSMFGWA
jgi:hypothetical protein